MNHSATDTTVFSTLPAPARHFSHETPIQVATQAAESLTGYVERLENLVRSAGDTKAGDVPLTVLFSILRAREQIRTDAAVIRKGRP